MPETKTIKAMGHTFEIFPATEEIQNKALANLAKDGVRVTVGEQMDLYAAIQRTQEIVRLCIKSWTPPQGQDPIRHLNPKDARAKIATFDGLARFILDQAEAFAAEGTQQWRLDEGN